MSKIVTKCYIFYFFVIRCESKPKRNFDNYKVKANAFGYRGDRDHFKKLEAEFELEPENLQQEMCYLKIFKSVKSVLDSKRSVKGELF